MGERIFKSRASKILSLLPLPSADSGSEDEESPETPLQDLANDIVNDIQDVLGQFEIHQPGSTHPLLFSDVVQFLNDNEDQENLDNQSESPAVELELMPVPLPVVEPEQVPVPSSDHPPICDVSSAGPPHGVARRLGRNCAQTNRNGIPFRQNRVPNQASTPAAPPRRTKAIVRKPFNWRPTRFKNVIVLQANCSSRGARPTDKRPIEFFEHFFTDEVLDMMVFESNLYSMQILKKDLAIGITKNDILDFLAILLITGVVTMPEVTDYWSNDLHFPKVADIMPKNKFLTIKRFLHFRDNSAPVTNGDRFAKIRPLFEKIREQCMKIPGEDRYAVDEMMIPYKGKKAGSLRQYVKNKPTKWGFKVFVRAGVSGIVYDMFLYSGADTFDKVDFTRKELQCFSFSELSVIALCKSIENKPLSVCFFDNWFSSPDLISYLRLEYGILSLATIRPDRVRGANFPSDTDMKKTGRGTFKQMVDNKRKIAIVKWFDNKPVMLATSYMDCDPVTSLSRWSKEKKKRENIPAPAQVKEYNKQMGGVDLQDMLISLYRTSYKSHKWYQNIFSQLLDIAVNNSWLLYRRDTDDRTIMNLKKFRLDIANDLILRNRQRKSVSSGTRGPRFIKVKKKKQSPGRAPSTAVRHDGMHHWPVITNRGNCKECRIKSVTKCQKCNIHLCLNKNKSCFLNYHGVDYNEE